MRERLQLGYLLIETANAPKLDAILTGVYGMDSAPAEPGTAYRIDEWDRRFVVIPGSADRLAGVGLVAADDETYAELVKKLTSSGHEVAHGAAAECRQRAVRSFVGFTDPGGLPIELAVSPSRARGIGYLSPAVPGGFRTGPRGLGHIVVLADDRDKSVDFYTGVLGFHVSDTMAEETPAGLVQATFLHCNRRHHTIAIGQRGPQFPPEMVLGHFMVEANTIDAVGMAYDRALDAQLPIARTFGRHPNDGMFSFYARTGCGFDIEFGANAIEIGDDWQVLQYSQPSLWGHRRGPGFD
jgi:biphenyl-2,3-diol 1,2-dioxygenase